MELEIVAILCVMSCLAGIAGRDLYVNSKKEKGKLKWRK